MKLTDIKTLGGLKASGYTLLPVKDELRKNLICKLKRGEDIFPGIIGFDRTVIPQIQNAILGRHDLILLGLRGQAKSRLIRMLPSLLDEFIRRDEHLFLVVDEYGGTEGIVTLEDAIETLLGVEISDELDSIEDLRRLAIHRMTRVVADDTVLLQAFGLLKSLDRLCYCLIEQFGVAAVFCRCFKAFSQKGDMFVLYAWFQNRTIRDLYARIRLRAPIQFGKLLLQCLELRMLRVKRTQDFCCVILVAQGAQEPARVV